MNEKQRQHMRDRFLNWTLPSNFNPDGGITFERSKSAVKFNHPWPTGTNVLDACQAEEMVKYIVEGLPACDAVLAHERKANEGLKIAARNALEALRDVLQGNDIAFERDQPITSWNGSQFRRRGYDCIYELQAALAVSAQPASESPIDRTDDWEARQDTKQPASGGEMQRPEMCSTTTVNYPAVVSEHKHQWIERIDEDDKLCRTCETCPAIEYYNPSSQPAAPTEQPSGDVVERMLDEYHNWPDRSSHYCARERERMSAALKVAREGMYSLEEIEKAIASTMQEHCELNGYEDFVKYGVRQRLTRPEPTPNTLIQTQRLGLDKLIDQRNRIVATEIPDPACDHLRDEVVLAFDILTQILGEHFPLMQESAGLRAELKETSAKEKIEAVLFRNRDMLGFKGQTGESQIDSLAADIVAELKEKA